MKISNINEVEERIDKYKAYKRFGEFQKTALEEAKELDFGPVNQSICLHLQLIGSRNMSKMISIAYGSELYSDIMECIECELNRIEDELSDL